MNQRKRAFNNGLSTIRRSRQSHLSRQTGTICAIRPTLYNAKGMPETNQILQGDSIQVLNSGPEGWIDLVFADPPFNIGYLYDGYDDRKKTDDYLNFSRDW